MSLTEEQLWDLAATLDHLMEQTEGAVAEEAVQQLDVARADQLKVLQKYYQAKQYSQLHANSKLESLENGALSQHSRERKPPKLVNYEILDVLGKGGMGVVWKAKQKLPGNAFRYVAIKEIVGAENTNARFHREIYLTANLKHSNIVELYTPVTVEGRLYYIMELLEGGTLGDKIKEVHSNEDANSFREAQRNFAKLMQSVAHAIWYAHTRPDKTEEHPTVLHRDIKPSNILLTKDGKPKVVDFGLAREIEQTETLTRSNAPPLGTWGYMAPEIISDNRNATIQSDIYSLGATLYTMLCGQPPLDGTMNVQSIRRQAEGQLLPPRQIKPTVDTSLQTICLKCLRADPAQRYVSALELANDLGRWLKGEPIQATPETIIERAKRWWKFHPWTVTSWSLVCILLVVVVVAGGVSYLFKSQLESHLTSQELKKERSTKRKLEELFLKINTVWRHDQKHSRSLLEQAHVLIQDLKTKSFHTELYRRWLAYHELDNFYQPIKVDLPERLTIYQTEERFEAVALCPQRIWVATIGRVMKPTIRTSSTVRKKGAYLRIWSATTGELVHTLQGHETGFADDYSLSFSPNGKFLVSSVYLRSGFRISFSTELKVWDVHTGECQRVFYLPKRQIRCIAISPDGKYLVAGTGASRRLLHMSSIAPKFLKNQPQSQLYVWDLTKMPISRPRSVEVGSLAVNDLSFSADGKIVASAEAIRSKQQGRTISGRFTVWKMPNVQLLSRVAVDTPSEGLSTIACHPEGKGLVWPEKGHLFFRDLEATKTVELSRWLGSKIPLGDYKGCPSGNVTPAARMRFEFVEKLQWSKDGRFLAIGKTAVLDEGRVTVISFQKKKVILNFTHPYPVRCLALVQNQGISSVFSIADSHRARLMNRSGMLSYRIIKPNAQSTIRAPSKSVPAPRRIVTSRAAPTDARFAIFTVESPTRLRRKVWFIRRTIDSSAEEELAPYFCPANSHLRMLDSPLGGQSLNISHNGHFAVIALATQAYPRISLWDLQDKRPKWEFFSAIYKDSGSTRQIVKGTAISNDGNQCAWSLGDAVYALIVNEKKGKQIWPYITKPVSVQLDPARPGSRKHLTGVTVTPILPEKPPPPGWNASDYKRQQAQGRRQQSEVTCLAFSYDSQWLALGVTHAPRISSRTYHELIILHIPTGKAVWKKGIGSGPVMEIQFSKDRNALCVVRPTDNPLSKYVGLVDWIPLEDLHVPDSPRAE